jgi:hypothetical protein
MWKPALLVTVLLFAASSQAAEEFKNRGAGATSCGTWTHEHQQRSVNATLQDQWVFGYVTAEELLSPTKRAKQDVDNQALLAWVTKWCAQNPLESVAAAAFVLTTVELRKGETAD